MVTYRTLAELEDAHDHERRTARLRIESADQYIGLYRSRIDQVGEAFHRLGAHAGVADDPSFRQELQRLADTVNQNITHAGHAVGELDDEYYAMIRQQDEQRDRFLAERADTD